MIVLLTNDDGIEAPGLAALEAACRGLACRLVVVAPKEPHSGCGHRVTTDRPLVLEQVGTDRLHVDGTPADCVRLALTTLLHPLARCGCRWRSTCEGLHQGLAYTTKEIPYDVMQ